MAYDIAPLFRKLIRSLSSEELDVMESVLKPHGEEEAVRLAIMDIQRERENRKA